MKRSVVPAILAFLLFGAGIFSAQRGQASLIEDPHFVDTWARTDKPVAEGMATRTWIWGPEAFTQALLEPYMESPGQMRKVQYFDKSRMEITNPGGDSSSPWYVTNGLLVVELVTGRMQVGDDAFEQREPAVVNVAGDADDAAGPTYATFGLVRGMAEVTPTNAIIKVLHRDGTITDDSSLASYSAEAMIHVPETNHWVADVFWQFMNSSGIIWDGHAFSEASLFPSPFYATGLPVSEAYWAHVKVAGTPLLVLIQCFERRCLTWTPSNPEGWQVENGNVGRHYFDWRYPVGPLPTATSTATETSTAPGPTDTVSATQTNVISPTSTRTPLNNETKTPTSTRTATSVNGSPTATRTATATGTATATRTATATATRTATPETGVPFGDGTYIVGTNIPPGTYRNSDSSDGCYWERLSGFSGELKDIIANEFTYARQIVTIKPSDVGFSSDDCGFWDDDLSPITSSPTAPFSDGTYFVGSEVSAGLWQNDDSSDGCYWARLRGFSGELKDIIANDFTYDPTIVSISASDEGFFTEGCGTWTKLPS